MQTNTEAPYRDPDHPSNKIRPHVKCLGCGEMGCITSWGPWCFQCNVTRMNRINRSLAPVAKAFGMSWPEDQ